MSMYVLDNVRAEDYIEGVSEGAMTTETETFKHECQCQEHDCKTLVEDKHPAACQRSSMLHLCPACLANCAWEDSK